MIDMPANLSGGLRALDRTIHRVADRFAAEAVLIFPAEDLRVLHDNANEARKHTIGRLRLPRRLRIGMQCLEALSSALEVDAGGFPAAPAMFAETCRRIVVPR